MKRIFLSALLVLSAFASFATEVPPRPEGFISDVGSTLTPDQQKAIDAKLRAFHDNSGGNMVVVILQTLKGEDIETAGINIAREWKVGKKGERNGLLFIVAIQEHKDRIEVGEGLESKITDGRAGQIADTARPFFRAKDWSGGINNVIGLCIGDITGAAPIVPVAATATVGYDLTWVWIFAVIILLIIIILAICKDDSGDSLLYGIVSSVSSSSSSNDWSSRDSSSSSSNDSSSSSDSGGSFGGGGGSSDW